MVAVTGQAGSLVFAGIKRFDWDRWRAGQEVETVQVQSTWEPARLPECCLNRSCKPSPPFFLSLRNLDTEEWRRRVKSAEYPEPEAPQTAALNVCKLEVALAAFTCEPVPIIKRFSKSMRGLFFTYYGNRISYFVCSQPFAFEKVVSRSRKDVKDL